MTAEFDLCMKRFEALVGRMNRKKTAAGSAQGEENRSTDHNKKSDVTDEEPKAAERTYKDAATAVSDVASEQPKTTSTHHTQTASRAFIMNAESSFLRVQKLYLEQLEMSNTL